MEHQFKNTDGRSLEGGWIDDRGKPFCRWLWNARTETLHVRCGSVTRARAIDVASRSSRHKKQLKTRLKQTALEIAKAIDSEQSRS